MASRRRTEREEWAPQFLRELHYSLLTCGEAEGPTQGYWTEFMTRVLLRTSNRLKLGLCSQYLPVEQVDWAKASKERGLRREYLFDFTMFKGWSGYELPRVVVEHENLYSKAEFLLDFWKLMLGFAPLRVMFGYTRRENQVLKRWNDVEGLSRTRDWVYPAESSDLVLIGHREMEPTGFKVWTRLAGQTEWKGPTELSGT